MEVHEILDQLEWHTGDFPRAALEAAIARKDEITTDLLRILDDTIDRAKELSEADGYMAHIYAMFLLAQFREPRAHPYLIHFAALPSKVIHALMGETLTEDFGRILASVSGGDTQGIHAIIETPDADEWLRSVAFEALLTLVAEQQLERDEVIRYLAGLFRGKLERQPSEVWNGLVATAADLYPAELMGDIEQAYQDGLVDPYNIDIEDVHHDLNLGMKAVLERLRDDSHHQIVRDAIHEMERWACFRNEPAVEEQWDEEIDELLEDELHEPAERFHVTSPIQRTSQKVGRNEPCPCGSGKKYKKCCGN